MSTAQVEIIEGDNALCMAAQLIDILRGQRYSTFRLTIRVADGVEAEIKVYLNGLRVESGTDSWIIHGYFSRGRDPLWVRELPIYRGFTGLYNVRTRKGFLGLPSK